jgi:hypothetical protein
VLLKPRYFFYGLNSVYHFVPSFLDNWS